MSRPIWKGPFVEKLLLKKLVKSAVKGKKRNKTIKTLLAFLVSVFLQKGLSI
jgi:ribosomal protein S19